jgi:hypothetical protein
MTPEQYKEYFEFYRDLYVKTAKAHEDIHKLCRTGGTIEQIKAIASQNTRIEGV